MLTNLNDSTIARLPLAQKGQRYEVLDKKQPGLILRIGSKKKSFYWRTRVNYLPVKVHLGEFGHTTVDQARLEVLKLILLSREGALPPSLRKEKSLRRPSPTLQAVLDNYLVMRKLRPATIEAYKKIARLYLPKLMPRVVTSITGQECMDLYQGIRDGQSTAKGNDAIRLLNALLTYAAATYDVEVCQVKAKLKAAKLLDPTPARHDYIKLNQLTAWFNSIAPRPLHYRVMLLLTLLTGFRRSEVQKLEWRDIDFTEGTALARDTKNHKDHLLPLGPHVLTVLKAFRPQDAKPTDTVFAKRIDRWCTLAARKSSVRFSLHTLRRSFASLATKIVSNAFIVKALLNHSTSGDVTRMHYVQLEVEDLRETILKIEDMVLAQTDLAWFLPEFESALQQPETALV